MTSGSAGALLGLVAGLGVWLILRRLPLRRRVTFEDRLAPYLRDTALPSTLLARRQVVRSAGGPLESLRQRVLPRLVARLDRAVGGSASIRLRIDQLGRGSVEEVRLEQLVWGGSALGVVLGLGLLKATFGNPVQPVALVLVCLVAGLAGVLARDRALTRSVAQRRQRILAEFPTVAELLALSVAAGEGPIGALERVSRLCSGELGRELGRTLADARAGATLLQALQQLADRAGLPVLRRFVDGVLVAVERGSPLAEVLRAQAVDVREAGRRDLIETAARREVAMMVPVVFLVLPVSVVFALFPGFYGLSLTA
jgi:tight adherence protein C